MTVSVETTQGLERRLSITVPADQVDEQVKKELREIAKNQRMDGFRKGKVPASIIQKRFGLSVRQDIASRIMQQKYIEAIIAEKLNPAGAPQLEVKSNEEGQSLEFTATFEIYPSVEVTGIENIVVEKPAVSVEEADLDKMMDTLRKQHATFVEVDREAKEGDKATIDFVGKIDGEEFEGGKAEGFALELGQGRMIPGFEEGVLGKKAGDDGEIEVTFPEDYHAENLKGKLATFSIKVSKVEEQQLPEVTDEFAQKFGVEAGTVTALREEVSKNMQRELDQAVKAKVKDQVIKGLLENNELELPKALIDSEVDNMRQQALQRMGANFDAANMPELPASMFEEQAKERVKVGLLLAEVISGNELKVDDEKVISLIETIASAYEDPSEVVEYYKQNDELMQQMRNVALEEQAIDLIMEKAKVEEKTATFDEIMNPQNG